MRSILRKFKHLLARFFALLTFRRVFTFMMVTICAWACVVSVLAATVFMYGDRDTAEPSDVIIVLGSGLRRSGAPGDALLRRSMWGARLYQQGIAPVVICSGGVGNGHLRSEAAACKEVLMSRGVPENAIYTEEQSKSTEENAIYSQQVMRQHDWQTAVIVTDSFHMLRANLIFDSYGFDHVNSPVPRNQVRKNWYIRHFSREILALHWQAFKDLLNLPITAVPG